MIPRALVAAMVLLTAPLPADALDLRERSDSASNQFSIYCEDRPLRMRVVSFVEEVKRDVLKTLGEREGWKAPIVITIERASPARAQEPAATVRLVESLPGFKVQIDVRIGRDPSAVNLQRQIVRAVLLEYAYREVGVKGGTEFRDAPWWVIEGCVGLARQREDGPNAAIFQQLLRTNKLPPLENFLSERPDELGATVRALDRALAACLVQLLTAQPGGPAALARLVRAWPQSNGAPLALLKKEFPVIAADEATLQKWWTLNLARFAAADRYRGLSVEETDQQLAPLLTLEIRTGQGSEKKTFDLTDYESYLPLPGSRAVLAEHHAKLIALSTRANALFRPVLVDYEAALALLARGKTKGVRERLASIRKYRADVLQRMSAIADYLNWFEATQRIGPNRDFDEYLKTAREISEQERKQRAPIARYLDELEREY
ncbi:MAG: hypothetical protein DVB27_10225 [Verrucomicrobia bacterium]|nr:MAG: hypothetical protein DVB27_10225 [Verrucomicrobiota bacterium]